MFLTRSFSSLPSLPFGVWAQGQPLGWMSALGSKSSPLTPQLTSAALPQQARRQVRCPPPLQHLLWASSPYFHNPEGEAL